MTLSSLPWLTAWLSNPTWQDSTWVVKGMQAHLWLAASQRTPAGVIPADDKWLRRLLGLPTVLAVGRAKKELIDFSSDFTKSSASSTAASKLPKTTSPLSAGLAKKIVLHPLDWQVAHALVLELLLLGDNIGEELRDAHQTVWQDHLWVNHWKPQLLADWQPIDANFLQTHPEIGKLPVQTSLYHPLAASLASQAVVSASIMASGETALSRAPNSASNSGTRSTLKPSKSQLSSAASNVSSTNWLLNPHGRLQLLSSPAFPLAALLKLKPSRLTSILGQSIGKPDKDKLWEIGMLYFTSDGHSEKQAGSLLGKLIKIHGEPTVLTALQSMMGRRVPPSDSFRFLQVILKQIQRGEISPAALKAQNQRAHVAI